jgi:hypothetical protein
VNPENTHKAQEASMTENTHPPLTEDEAHAYAAARAALDGAADADTLDAMIDELIGRRRRGIAYHFGKLTLRRDELAELEAETAKHTAQELADARDVLRGSLAYELVHLDDHLDRALELEALAGAALRVEELLDRDRKSTELRSVELANRQRDEALAERHRVVALAEAVLSAADALDAGYFEEGQVLRPLRNALGALHEELVK